MADVVVKKQNTQQISITTGVMKYSVCPEILMLRTDGENFL